MVMILHQIRLQLGDIQKVTSYMAIGAGQTYALAALYLGQTAEKAVETAIELSIYCAYPIRKLSR